jgi:arylsulfatase A-like enzyme
METLKQHDAEKDTIVIFTSDNGPEVLTTVRMRKDHQHDAAAPWRGMKRDLWEGGHRVPMIVKWPEKVPANTTSHALICQTDLMATLAAITDTQLPENCAEDSIDFSHLLLEKNQTGHREFIIHQGFAGDRKLAIRSKEWKYLNCRDSGGNNYEKQPLLRPYYNDSQSTADAQLYNLAVDPAETNNLYLQEPEMAIRMRTKLEEIKFMTRKSIPKK